RSTARRCVRTSATPGWLGDEDGAAANVAGVEVGEGEEGGRQRVGPGVQRDLSRLGEDHQLGEVVVRADEVADDVDLGRDDVGRREAYGAAVAGPEDQPAPPPN